MSESTPKSQHLNSPKKFFRALNVSPFRPSASRKNPLDSPKAENRPIPFPSPPATFTHSRSQSHDSHSTFFARNYNPSYRSPSHSRQNSQSTNWKSLIPPVPPQSSETQSSGSSGQSQPSTPSQGANSGQNSSLKLPLEQRHRSKSPPSNRHTIAVSPNAPFHIPDMLQPSDNLNSEGTFVLRRQELTNSPVELHPSRPPTSMPPKAGEHHRSHTYPEKTRQSSNPFHTSFDRNPSGHNSQTSQSQNYSMPRSAAPTSSRPNGQASSANSPVSSHGVLHADYQGLTRPSLNSQSQQRAASSHSSSQSSVHTANQYLAQMQGSRGPSHSSQGQEISRDQPREVQKNPSGSKKRKMCFACQEVINGQFVRALGKAYHIDCFKCHECGVKCSSKFFPFEVTLEDATVLQVPLCEYDYFKKLDLICFTCDNALRGPYITALGNKYHLEHFKCSACGKVFESDESYYEHENNIYCHFHYSKLFATKCEGCQSSIIKQFVELFKSGKNQQWHPECYMVFKFWNVSLTPDCVGLPDSLSAAAMASELAPKDLLIVESKIEAIVLKCWITLSGFEETSASCISEMLLSACTGKRSAGLHITGKLVIFLEILFKGLDLVSNMCLEFKSDKPSMSDSKISLIEEIYSVDAFDKFQSLRKEPRNISGKLMSYLAILRKSNQISGSGSLSAELLSVITGCAHYLKLLIRFGLSNALKLNKLRSDTKALDGFLGIIKAYEEIDSDKISAEQQESIINSRLAVRRNATDSCKACSKSIEKACVLFENTRWHIKCFECSNCQRKPSSEFKVESFLYGADDLVLCTECSLTQAKSGVGYTSGFVRISDLSQLAYLLKIAILRTKSAIKKDSLVAKEPAKAEMSHIMEEPSETETTYSKTLDEVTLLRTKRESQKLYSSVKRSARKSVIIEAPEAATARADNTIDETRIPATRKESSASTASFIPSSEGDNDEFNFQVHQLKIRDEPQQRASSSSLNRTSDLLKNEKSLTLDDIPRIVAAEQAREQRPNAFKHHNSLYQKKNQQIRTVSKKTGNASPAEAANSMPMPSEQPTELKYKYFSELTAQEHKILRFVAVEAFLEMCNEYSREELWNLVLPKKPGTFWDKFRFGNNDKSKALAVFGSDLKEVTKKYGVDSSLGVGPSQLRIPIVVDDVIQALRQKDMSVEGIFRLNGNIKNLRELTTQINNAPLKSPVFSNYSAVQLAALMKKWLRELPNPLLTFKLYDLWILSRKAEPEKRKRVLQLVCCMLPRSHRNLLEVLLYFFSWVASFAEIDEETGSKMDTHNLATVIAPNILLSKASTLDSGENQSSDAHFLAIEVVNQLIEAHEELAVIPPDLWELYESCHFPTQKDKVEMSPKEVTARIQQTLKNQPNFFADFEAKKTEKTLR